MAGGLTNFPMVLASGTTSVAGAVGYNGVSAGYTSDPQETINYVSSHDNQILWDIVQYKMPTGRSMDDRVRAAALAIDVVLLGQGIPFIPMGDDLLRSKSMERDSYDSGDWFNRVDWTGASQRLEERPAQRGQGLGELADHPADLRRREHRPRPRRTSRRCRPTSRRC